MRTKLSLAFRGRNSEHAVFLHRSSFLLRVRICAGYSTMYDVIRRGGIGGGKEQPKQLFCFLVLHVNAILGS